MNQVKPLNVLRCHLEKVIDPPFSSSSCSTPDRFLEYMALCLLEKKTTFQLASHMLNTITDVK